MDIQIIFGPTSSGKTKLALSIAQKFSNKVEIISADSRQIYKYCQIGTGSIDNKRFEKNGIKVHLSEILEPNENYSVSLWQKAAYKLIEEIKARDKIPIVVGGTGLYIDSLIYKREYGNNLEPITSSVTFLTPNIEREEVYKNIDTRVDQMFELGFVEEVKKLTLFQHSFLGEGAEGGRGLFPILQGAGYKQILEYLENQRKFELGENFEIIPRFRQKYILDLETCKEKVKISYRNYAKRQYTWFRKYFEKFKVEKIKVS